MQNASNIGSLRCIIELQKYTHARVVMNIFYEESPSVASHFHILLHSPIAIFI